MSVIFRIYLIGMGLPLNIQDKLGKEAIINTELLKNNKRVYDLGHNKQRREDRIKFNNKL